MAKLNPDADCVLCPRLAGWRKELRRDHAGWHNAPVACFGDSRRARLLIVGLAPGKSGANRTGRPFTGDKAGDVLYKALLAAGFAQGAYRAQADDGLNLRDCVITNAVRCVPPENKPTPEEIRTCRRFLAARMAAMPRLHAILALGRIAHESVLRVKDLRLADFGFRHGARHNAGGMTLFDSYHCSRRNISTGILTEAGFARVLRDVRGFLSSSA